MREFVKTLWPEDTVREYVENMANYRLHIEKRIDWAESDVSIAYHYDFNASE